MRLVCSGYGASPNSQAHEIANHRAESSKRKRTYRSCTACRASKTKCSGERPTCRRCQEKGHNCVYSESSQPGWIQRVEDISSDSKKPLSTPSLIPDRSPSSQLEHETMRLDHISPHSRSLSFEQSLLKETIESAALPLNW